MVDPDYNEILDIIFDDEISEILAEMEDSPKLLLNYQKNSILLRKNLMRSYPNW